MAKHSILKMFGQKKYTMAQADAEFDDAEQGNASTKRNLSISRSGRYREKNRRRSSLFDSLDTVSAHVTEENEISHAEPTRTVGGGEKNNNATDSATESDKRNLNATENVNTSDTEDKNEEHAKTASERLETAL